MTYTEVILNSAELNWSIFIFWCIAALYFTTAVMGGDLFMEDWEVLSLNRGVSQYHSVSHRHLSPSLLEDLSISQISMEQLFHQSLTSTQSGYGNSQLRGFGVTIDNL